MIRSFADHRIARHVLAVAVLTTAACSADPGSSFSPNLAIDRPTGYPEAAAANCNGPITDELVRLCWTEAGSNGQTIFAPPTQVLECRCVNGNKP